MTVLALLSQANGRDKIARFLQYLFRTISYLKENASTTNDYKNLEATFSTFRKLLRFGRSLESLYSASKLIESSDIVKRLSALIKVANGCYLLCDHIEILGRLKMINVDAKDWNLTANRYWFLTDVLNLVQNYYQLKECYSQLKSNIEIRSSDKIKYLLPIYIDIMKNVCDIFLPMSTISLINLSSGSTGLFGMASSLLGLFLLIQPFTILV